MAIRLATCGFKVIGRKTYVLLGDPIMQVHRDG